MTSLARYHPFPPIESWPPGFSHHAQQQTAQDLQRPHLLPVIAGNIEWRQLMFLVRSEKICPHDQPRLCFVCRV